MTEVKKQNDPYRYMFPLGIIAGVLGVLLWFFFQYQWISFYPRQAHAGVMYFAFFWSFVAGFLMTAIPKMTNSIPAVKWEINGAMLFVVAQLVANYFDYFQFSIFLYLLQVVFLLIFIFRRWLLTKRIPFEGFIFVPFAFFQALLGLLLFIVSESFSASYFYLLVGEAFIINLVLGIGSRLIPVLSRVPGALTPDITSPNKNYFKMASFAILLNSGFWVQIFQQPQLGYAIRFLTVLAMSVSCFRLFARVNLKSFVGLGLRSGIVFILASYFLAIFQFVQSLAIQHLLYIGGFTLITIMVGTRVMLAHGGESIEYEIKSPRLAGVALLLGLSSLLRLFAGSKITGLTMNLSILVFLVGILAWVSKFLKIQFK